MTIKTTTLGGTDFASGVSTTLPTDLNDTFGAVSYRSLAVDTASTTLASSVDSTTLVATLAVPANAVDRFVQVFFDFYSTGSMGGNTGSDTATINVSYAAGIASSETEKLVQTISRQTGDSDGNRGYIHSGGTHMFYYEPTSIEKTTGFNIKISVIIDTTDSLLASIVYNRSRVMGC